MNKPKHHLDMLGLDVEIANKRIPQDAVLKERLKDVGRDLGKAIPEGSFQYCGTVATHIYTNEFGREVRYIHQHGFDKQVHEKVLSTAIGDLSVHLMETVFGRKKPSTLNPRDQRGKKRL